MKNLSIILFILFFTFAFSQNPEWINYTSGKIITEIIEEGNYLWIGTTGGIVKLHKQTGQTEFFNKSNSGLPDNDVNAITVDEEGNKWIGTWGGGLAKFDGVSWTVYNTSNSGLPDNYIIAIAIDKEGNKWIGTDGGGLAVYREGGVVFDVVEDKYAITRDFSLLQIYPNPFNSSTTISYQLPITTKVTIEIYNILGRKVKTLVNKRENAGTYSVSFDCSNLPSGVYFCRFHAGSYYDTKKLLLLK